MQSPALDQILLSRFNTEVAARVPHVEADGNVVNATPLMDLTEVLKTCSNEEFGIQLPSGVKVFGKFDSKIAGGSVKVRPAVRIVLDAISSGRITRTSTIFEATSGNFGSALGLLGKLDLKVVALVSRKLQPGVLDQLRADGIRLIHLDIDICPAPGLKGDVDLLMAKGVASSVRQQLSDIGLDPSVFDGIRSDAEILLARQDVINLAKLFARAYGGFCPEQYDNELNMKSHEQTTGPEIAQQLKESNLSPTDFDVVCAFGTGGTATGLSRFGSMKQGRKYVHVVYPLSNQDVAGIRTKDKSQGLKFYRPEEYASENEVDFEEAKKVLNFFNERGYDIGESGALALYATLDLTAAGKARNAVVMIADGASKYASAVQNPIQGRLEVSLEGALAERLSYSGVVWTHGSFVPNETGIEAIAAGLGIEKDTIRIAKIRDLQNLMNGQEIPEVFAKSEKGRKILLVCMVGGTSLMVARTLTERGVHAESLVGGITGMPAMRGKPPFGYLSMASE